MRIGRKMAERVMGEQFEPGQDLTLPTKKELAPSLRAARAGQPLPGTGDVAFWKDLNPFAVIGADGRVDHAGSVAVLERLAEDQRTNVQLLGLPQLLGYGTASGAPAALAAGAAIAAPLAAVAAIGVGAAGSVAAVRGSLKEHRLRDLVELHTAALTTG